MCIPLTRIQKRPMTIIMVLLYLQALVSRQITVSSQITPLTPAPAPVRTKRWIALSLGISAKTNYLRNRVTQPLLTRLDPWLLLLLLLGGLQKVCRRWRRQGMTWVPGYLGHQSFPDQWTEQSIMALSFIGENSVCAGVKLTEHVYKLALFYHRSSLVILSDPNYSLPAIVRPYFCNTIIVCS